MIRIARHLLVFLAGGCIAWSLTGGAFPVVLPIGAAVYGAIWLGAGVRFPSISLPSLPLLLAAVLAGYFQGSPALNQGVLFILLLWAWETDLLYRERAGAPVADGELKLLLPLVYRNLSGLLLLAAVHFLTRNRELSIGFWPTVLAAALLVLLLRRIFRGPAPPDASS